jgi:predicted CxxxxCH...CXXCH cytochrome family protein
MRRHALLVTALIAAAISLVGCDKARRTMANPTGPSGCLGCHGSVGGDPSGAPPNDLAGSDVGGAVGAHTAHLGKQVACEECHKVPGRISDPGHIVKLDGTPDPDGRGEVVFGPRATNGGTFSASFAPAPLPGKGGTCNVYCHGGSLGAAGGSNTRPKWGDPQMNCGSCHGDGTGTVGAPRGGSHGPTLTPTDCAACHPDTVGPGGEIVPGGTHINGNVEAKGCTNCHGNASRGETATAPSWAPPKDGQGGTDPVKVGAHLRHVSSVVSLGSRISKRFDCSECHMMPKDFRAVGTPGGVHNQPVMQWASGTNNIVATGNLIPVYSGGSCSATWCHGAGLGGGTNTSPAWNSTGAGACGSCHFIANPAAPHPAKDLVGVNITGVAQCAQCHPGTVNAGGSINVNGGMHVNGRIDTDVHTPTYANPTEHGPQALQGLQACKTCHGADLNGQGGATPSCTTCHAAAGHPTWLNECTFCHGSGNRAGDAGFALVGNPAVRMNQASPPVGTQLETAESQPAVGAHVAHINPASSLNGALSVKIQCTECHGSVLPTNADHADGSVAIGWGALATARATSATPAAITPAWELNPTCTNYCHGGQLGAAGLGTNRTPSWVAGASQATCGTCHGFRPGTWHPNNSSCGQCHPGYTSTTVVQADHVNGTIDPATTTCASCHPSAASAPPWIDTTGATGGVKVGAHQAHISGGTLVAAGYGCAVCHTDPASMRHANDQVDMAWPVGGLASAKGVVPTPAGGPLGAWTTPTCTNYCHGASLTSAGGTNRTPNWTGGASQDACGTCHASPPPLSVTAGQDHPRNSTCANCHGAGYSQAAVVGTAALTSHINGTTTLIVVGCTRCHGDRTDLTSTPTTNLVASAPGEGNVLASADITGATNAITPRSPGLGAHVAHLSSTTYRSVPLACTECHAVPALNDTSHATGVAPTGGARATLVWGALARGAGSSLGGAVTPSYAGSTSAAGGTTAGNCTSTYCHGQFTNGNSPVVSWTATAGLTCNSCHGVGNGVAATVPRGTHQQVNSACGDCHPGYTTTTVNKATHIDGSLNLLMAGCTLCHGDAARVGVTNADSLVDAAPPKDSSGALSGTQVGAHLAHVNQGSPPAFSAPLGCGNCHVVPSASGPHPNPGVFWSGLAVAGGASPLLYNSANQSCSSTYCHGQFPGGTQANVVFWGTGTTAKLGCTSCHAAPPAHPHPSNGTCASCHAGYTAATVAAALHVNGSVEKTTSGCTSCHGELTAAAVTPTNNLVAAAPGATGTNTVDTAGQTAATAAGVGAHKAHLGAGVISHVAIACGECHAVPVAGDTAHATGAPPASGSRATVTWGPTATRSVNAWSGAPVVPTYLGSTSATVAGAATGGSCASTYCHGNFSNGRNATVAWSTPGAMTCNSCHGAGTGATATLPPAPHPQGNTTCSVCHVGYTNTSANPTSHLNGRLDRAADSCTGCHGNSNRASVATATDLDVFNQPLQQSAPPVGVTAGNQVGAHLAHVNQGASGTPLSSAVACVACHVVPAGIGHSDGVTTVAWGDISINAGASPSFNTTTHGCSATYCHGQFPGGIQANVVAWGSGSTAGTKLGCASCHASPPPHPHPSNTTNCATCHAGYTASTVVTALHVDGAVNKTTAGCTACHGELPAAGVTLTSNLVAAAPGATGTNSIDTAGLSGITTSAGTGAHRAHLVGTLYRAALACTECHALPATNADTTHGASGAGSGGARATLTWGTLARGAAATFNNELVAPAYSGSQTGVLANTAGSCASTYCHGQFKNGKKATVGWTAAPGLTCNSCHGAGTGASATLPGGTHPQGSTACGNCHTGYSNTTVVAATHLNGLLDVISMTCTTCHGDATRTPVASATWNDINGTSLVRAAPPVDGTGAAAGNLVGAHLAHINQGSLAAPGPLSNALRCENCHNGLVWTTGPHATPINPIVWGNIAIADAAVPTGYNVGTKTCSNTYCHGSFPYGKGANSIGWGNGTFGKLGCTACHGQGTTASQPAHPHPQNTTCATCHPGYSGTAVVVATHVDGLSNKSTSGCTGCHGELNAAGVTPTVNLVKAAPGGSGSATNSFDTTGAVATTAAGVGAHKAHLVGVGGTPRWRSTALACTECHAVPALATDIAHATGVGTGTARALLTWGSLATGGATTVPAYATPTCTSVYCHNPKSTDTAGSAKAPSWIGVTGLAACGSCHGLPPITPQHPTSAAACSSCHDGYANAPTAASTGTAVSMVNHINGSVNVSMDCTSCHGTAGRPSVAGADPLQPVAPPVASSNTLAVGAHLAHVNQQAAAPALSPPFSCVNCHTGMIYTSTPHTMPANPVAFGNVATVGTTPLAYVTASQTCSNTYCHGQFTGGKTGTSIAWNTAGKLTCTSCHGQGTTASQPAHPHPQNTTCASCHLGYTSTTVAATTHVDGVVSKVTAGCTACHGERTDIAVTPTLNLVKAAPGATGTVTTSADTVGATATTAAGVGAHKAHLVGTAGTPRWRTAALACTECHAVPAINDTAHATGVGTGTARALLTWGTLATGGATVVPAYATPTCSSTYCHAPHADTAAGLTLAPSWIGVATAAACGSCHGLPPITAQHPTGAAACGSCHDGYANSPTVASTSTAVSMGNHINGIVNVKAMSCTSCHGTAGRVSATGADALQEVAPPVASTNTLAVGAHLAHINQQAAAPALSAPFTCVNCHTGMIYTSTPHTVPTNPVAFGNVATAGVTPLAYVTATQTCSNTYCHGQFTGGKTGTSITWNAAGKLTCTGCHGQGTTASQPAHPHPQNTTCASCHTGYTSTAVAAATHVNGTVNKSTAGCTACHGDRADTAVTPALNLFKSAPGATAALTSADTTGATATTVAGVGAHKAHLVGTAGTPRWRTAVLACTECHAVPAINDTAHATGVGTGTARALLTWGTLATGGATVVPAYATPTCSSTYCHAPHADTAAGLTLAPSWIGVATAAACGSCHGLPPITAQHPTGAAACATCHDGYANSPTVASTSTAVSMANHINGVVNVKSMTCTSCHGTLGRVSVAGADALQPVAPPAAASNTLAVGAHLAHVNQQAASPALSAPFACVNCHTGLIYTAAPHTVPANPVVFGNLATTGPVTPVAYATATQTCSNTYCHGQFTGGKTGTSITWNAAGKLTCSGCHGQSVAAPQPNYPHPQNTGCVNCHGAGYSSTTVVAATHVNGSVTRLTAGCTGCHGELKAPGVTLVANLVKAAPGASGSGTNSFDSVGGTTGNTVGAHRAHLVGAGAGATPRWRSTVFTCAECHTLPPSATDTSHSTGVGNGGSRATLTFGALANDTAFETKTASYLTPTCTSVYCHNPKGTDTAAGNKLPAWNGATTTVVCGSCHGLPPVTAAHPTGVTECASCHGGGYATTKPTAASTIAQVNALIHINGQLEGGGDCVGCHETARGTRRAIVPEFRNAWSHKRSSSGGVPANTVVTKWDCVVCHMEGDATSGGTSGVHQNGVIDLRDPDTGTTIQGVSFGGNNATSPGAYTSTGTPLTFAKFSRNLASNVLEASTVAIMINQCLKCHDADGALSSLARVPTPVMPNASAAKPFGTTIAGAAYTGTNTTAGGMLGGVVDVSASFKTVNSSYHPIFGKQNNSYVGNARMYAPWNTLAPAKTPGTINAVNSWGFLISCWDCHAPLGTASTVTLTGTITAHGGATTLRQAYRVVNATNLCTVCHNVTVGTSTHGAGSAWATTGHSGPGGIAKTSCYRCHSSNETTTPPARPIPAQDAHGFNSFAPAMGTDTLWPVGTVNTYRPYGFMRSAGPSGMWTSTSHKPLSGPGVPTGAATCGGNASLACGSENHSSYTPGGVY